jgi:hypothetical protein
MSKRHLCIVGLFLVACGGHEDRAPSDVSLDVDAGPGAGTVVLEAPTAPRKGTVSVQAMPDPADGVIDVRFHLDGNETPIEVDLTPPFGVSLEPGSTADGAHTIRAVARWADGRKAEGSVEVTLDNEAPAVTSVAPEDGASVLPPFVVPFALEVADPAGLALGTVSVVGGASYAIDAPAWSAQVALDPGDVFPVKRDLTWSVQDVPGNEVSGTLQVTATHVRMSVPGPQTDHAVVLPIGGRRTIALYDDEVRSFGLRGEPEWNVSSPPGLIPVWALRAPGGKVAVLHESATSSEPGTGLSLLDETGSWLWHAPSNMPSRAYMALGWDEATESFVATTREKTVSAPQTGKLVEVSSEGEEVELAPLDPERVGVALRMTPAGTGDCAIAVTTVNTSGPGEGVQVHARGGEKLWGWEAGDDFDILATMPMGQDVVAVAVQSASSPGPVLEGVTPSGTAWTLLPGEYERLSAGLVLDTGDLVVRGEVDGFRGSLYRVKSDGTVRWHKTWSESIASWLLMGDRVAVGRGDRVEVLGAGGEVEVQWEVPSDPDSKDPVVLLGLVRGPDDGLYVITGRSGEVSHVRVWLLDASGATTWSEVLEGEVFVQHATGVEEGEGLLLVTDRWKDPSSAEIVTSVYALE